jgi:AraC family transcriptional regulator
VSQAASCDVRIPLNPPAELLGQRNAIISWRGGKRVDDVVGPLSIKWMPIGWSVWRTADRTYRVEGDRFLILNHGRAYSLAREASEPQESFCPFFASSFVEGVHRDLVRADHLLLDDGPDAIPTRLEFREELYAEDGRVLRQLRRMWTAVRCGQATQSWLEAEFHALAERLLCSRADVQQAIDRLPARRSSTRTELHRRLQRGREFIHAHFAERPCLEQIARAAGMSPHHFHRVFRAAFGRTPHDYLTQLRLERAVTLLSLTDEPVTEICFAVGFESVGSFTTLFHRRTGLSPSAMRRVRRQLLFARIEKPAGHC